MDEQIKINGIYDCLGCEDNSYKGTFKKCLVLCQYKSSYACVDVENERLYWTKVVTSLSKQEDPKPGEIWKVYHNGDAYSVLVESFDYGILKCRGCFNMKNYKFDISNNNAYKAYDDDDQMLIVMNDKLKVG